MQSDLNEMTLTALTKISTETSLPCLLSTWSHGEVERGLEKYFKTSGSSITVYITDCRSRIATASLNSVLVWTLWWNAVC